MILQFIEKGLGVSSALHTANASMVAELVESDACRAIDRLHLLSLHCRHRTSTTSWVAR